jgi:23S rRNA (cytidine1920-2'-O)/16S rRNA (cytidine1409-2'-O)-methyltransferase
VSEKKRLDLYLVEKSLAQSRTHAQELIEAGQVFVLEGTTKKILKKPSLSVDGIVDKIQVEQGPANRFVSRGGLKLEGALQHVGLSVENLKALDVGISTGGFSDCLLQQGANLVVGVDVGHGQLNPVLAKNPKLKSLEGVNARALTENQELLNLKPAGGFDLVVMDVSFISIELIIPEIAKLLKAGGILLSLVKPQFEVGVDGLAKGGIVKDVSLFAKVEEKIRSCCAQHGLVVQDYFSSSIEGKDGNHEFFVFAKKP